MNMWSTWLFFLAVGFAIMSILVVTERIKYDTYNSVNDRWVVAFLFFLLAAENILDIIKLP